MAISCSDLKEDLSSYLDGELEQDRQVVVTEHLAACPKCQSATNRFRNLSKLLAQASFKVQESAPDIWTLVSAKLPGVCECIQDDLSAYLDGELLVSAKEGVSTHLDQCSPCLTKFKQLSQVNSMLAKGLALPEGIEVDIWSKVKSRLNDDCMLIQSELSLYMDREVATLRHRAITQHLMECADCQFKFNALSRCGETIRNYYQPEMPVNFDLWPQIQAKMNVLPFEAKDQARKIRNFRPAYAVAAAAVLGTLAATTMFLNSHNTALPAVTAENYMIDSTLQEPADIAEAVVYEH